MSQSEPFGFKNDGGDGTDDSETCISGWKKKSNNIEVYDSDNDDDDDETLISQ